MLTQEEVDLIANILEEHIRACHEFHCPEEAADTTFLKHRLLEENQSE